MIGAVFYAHMIPALFPKRAPLRLLVLGGACSGAGLGAQIQAMKASQVWSEIWSEDTVSARWVVLVSAILTRPALNHSFPLKVSTRPRQSPKEAMIRYHDVARSWRHDLGEWAQGPWEDPNTELGSCWLKKTEGR